MIQALINIQEVSPTQLLRFTLLAPNHGDALDLLMTNGFQLQPRSEGREDHWLRTSDSGVSITFKKGLNGAGGLVSAGAKGSLMAFITLLDILPESGDVICEDLS